MPRRGDEAKPGGSKLQTPSDKVEKEHWRLTTNGTQNHHHQDNRGPPKRQGLLDQALQGWTASPFRVAGPWQR